MDQYCVMGNPVQHSKSPLIYRLFAEQTGQSIHYSPLLVELDGLIDALGHFQAQGGKGVNITLPFKHRAFALVDTLSDRAQRAEAVNFIRFNEDGSRYGDNTDGIGLIRDIATNYQCSLRNKNILVLGAGGAVRGILEPILNQQPELLVIANRTENKALALVEEFADLGPIRACPLLQLSQYSFDLVINGTSASLQGELVDLPGNILRENAFCYDIMYGKGMTPFLTWAKVHGAAMCVDGIGMLVEQAAESFYGWRNIKPDTSPVLSVLKKMYVEC